MSRDVDGDWQLDNRLRPAATVCAALSVALPIFLVVFGDRLEVRPGIENSWILARAWLTLVYFGCSLVAVLGLASACYRRAPALSVVAAVFFVVGTAIDLLFRAQALLIVQRLWSSQLGGTGDSASLSGVSLMTDLAGGYQVGFLFGFGVARLLFALALWSSDWLSRATATAWLLLGLLNLQTVATLLGAPAVLPVPGVWYMLPWGLSFALLAAWLKLAPRSV